MTESPEHYPRDDCYFCGEDTDVLERHHLVPQRKGGSDKDENLVQICPTCHQKLERLYDDRFYNALGANDSDEVVTYALEYVLFELEQIDSALSERLRDTREHLGTLQSGEIHEDDERTIQEYIREGISKYYQEKYSTAGDDGDTETGTSKVQREKIKAFKMMIDALENKYDEGAPVNEVIRTAVDQGYDRSTVEKQIEKLKTKGELYEPRADYLRTC